MSVKILTPLSAAERWKKGVFPTLQQPESQPMSEEEVVPLEKCMQLKEYQGLNACITCQEVKHPTHYSAPRAL